MTHFTPPPPPPPQLTAKLTAFLLPSMLLLAVPATAQVVWSSILGGTGSAFCAGLSETRASVLNVSANPTKNSIGIS